MNDRRAVERRAYPVIRADHAVAIFGCAFDKGENLAKKAANVLRRGGTESGCCNSFADASGGRLSRPWAAREENQMLAIARR